MRRLAFGFAFLWLAVAFSIRLYDMRSPQLYISALTGGQRDQRATLAWLQGTRMSRKQPAVRSAGRVVDARLDGKDGTLRQHGAAAAVARLSAVAGGRSRNSAGRGQLPRPPAGAPDGRRSEPAGPGTGQQATAFRRLLPLSAVEPTRS